MEIQKKSISKKLQTVLHRKKLNDIENHKDQGKVITAAALHPSSNVWIKDGKYTTFGQYRSSIKARLDLLPVGSGKERMRKCHPGSGRIPKETLPHTLNHCPPHMPLIRARHNSILDRLTKDVPDTFQKFKEQVIPGDTDQLKPDLVLVNSETRKGFIIDVTIPFDDSQDALKDKRRKRNLLSLSDANSILNYLWPEGKVTERMKKCPPGSSRCSSCGNPQETLPHVLNHCPPLMPAVRARHNTLLDRLIKALPEDFVIYEFREQSVLGDESLLKPDLVLVNPGTRKGFVIDVTIPFDDSQDALRAARQKKKRSTSI